MAQVKPANKKKMSKTALIALIVCIAILVGFVLSIGASTGFFIRIQTAVSSENFKINGSMASYFTHYYYENWSQSDTGKLYIQYKLFDSSKAWDEQPLFSDATKTYADYFAEGGMALAERYVKLCEAAKKAGKYDELKEKAKTEVDNYVDSYLQLYAYFAGFTNATGQPDIDAYVKSAYGESVSTKDVKDCLILEHIASSYYQLKRTEIFDDMEKDETKFNDRIDTYFENNLSSFVTAEYITLVLSQPNATVKFPVASDYEGGENSIAYKADLKTATDNNVAADELPQATDYEGGENSKAYIAAKLQADTKAQANADKMKEHEEIMKKLEAAESLDAFKTIILDHYYSTSFDSAYADAKKGFGTNDIVPSTAQLNAYKDAIKDLVIAATVAGETNIAEEELTKIIEEVLKVVEEEATPTDDASTTTTTKTDTKWKEAMKSIPASLITALNTTLTNATKTASYSVSTDPEHYTNKLFGGVKDKFGIELGENDIEGATSAKVDDHWYRETAITALENNIKSIEKKITDLKADLDKADADKEAINEDIEAQEELLETAKKNLEDAKKANKYTFTAYYVTKEADRDEDHLRNVGHILFKVDTTVTETDPEVSYKTEAEAKEAAQKLFDELKALADKGQLTKELFEAMGKDVTHDSNVFYDDVNKDQMVAEFEDWLFDTSRKEGELGLVKTSYGWHIMYYVGEAEDIVWRVNAHEGATDEDLEDWYSELDDIKFDNPSLFRFSK